MKIKFYISLWLLLLWSFLFVPPVNADESEIKYQVTIEITYNAVAIEEANEIMADAIARHKDACKTEVKAEKVGSYIDSNYTTYVTDTITLTSTDD